MSAGYYEYEPTHVLNKPLVLVSFVNELTRAVASSLASTTGLPLRLVDDAIEHQLGASSVEVLDSQRLRAWRDVEKQQVAQLVRARPSAIIALGEGALDEDESRNLILAQSDLVYLYLSFGEASERFARQASNRKATVLAELQDEAGWSEDGLIQLFTRRRAAYERAQRSVDVRGESTLEISSKLTRLLDG